MVTITVEDDALHLEVNGLDKLWSLCSRLKIPLVHVRSAHASPDVARRWFEGLKVAGSYIPGVLTAGTFYHEGGLVFWDVHHPDRAIAIDLDHERYQRLIVEVADPAAALRQIEEALKVRVG